MMMEALLRRGVTTKVFWKDLVPLLQETFMIINLVFSNFRYIEGYTATSQILILSFSELKKIYLCIYVSYNTKFKIRTITVRNKTMVSI